MHNGQSHDRLCRLRTLSSLHQEYSFEQQERCACAVQMVKMCLSNLSMVSLSYRLRISQKSHLDLQRAAGWQFLVLLCCSYPLSPAIVTHCQRYRSMHTIPCERVPRLSRICEISPRIECGQLIELGRQRCKEHLFMMLRLCEHFNRHTLSQTSACIRTCTRFHKAYNRTHKRTDRDGRQSRSLAHLT